MKLSTILLGFLISPLPLPAGTTLSAHADGELLDSDGDGIFETIRKDSLEFRVLASPARKSCAVLEFKMPEGKNPAKKVMLRLYLNGKSGSTAWPETAGSHGPECVLFGYLAPNADGELSLSDDGTGEKITPVLEAKATDVKQPLLLDVTTWFNRAVDRQSPFIGFRIETTDQPGSPSGWRFRSSEFGRKYSERWTPALLVSR